MKSRRQKDEGKDSKLTCNNLNKKEKEKRIDIKRKSEIRDEEALDKRQNDGVR